MTKPLVFKGDTFRNLLKQYSFQRMERDSGYRTAVRKAALARKLARQRVDNEKDIKANVDASANKPLGLSDNSSNP